ncbi:MFS transporter [Kitasatospora sp. RB6PN24]|uniref:MFS transporter n=1 Tax=Kitasatospora humi TaxID=2893891 RepID=UPI001E5E9B57|nr:MFS transporter [Kitasatospora humi]MCC9308002.1 MFS transporter [Kitasatospora humi]
MTTALQERRGPGRARGVRSAMSLLRREENFRWFLPGHATSLFGSAMAPVALAFALLPGSGGADTLGWVLTARIVPVVLMLLVGGAAADRLGSRRVMLTADAVRVVSQSGFALALLTGYRPLGLLLALAAVGGVGEAVFTPALNALIPRLAPAEQLAQANATITLVRSTANVAGPALAGLLTAWAGPGVVLAADAGSFAVSLLALSRVVVALPPPAGHRPGLLAELRDGWGEFRSHNWLWTTCLQACFFNLLLWAPFLVLGPADTEQHLGGARAWGVVLACFGGGSVLGSLLLLGRDPRRPVLVSTITGLGYVLPSAALACRAALTWVCAAALLAGIASAVGGSLSTLAWQRLIPRELQARVSAYGYLGAFALGPVGLALAGPAAALLGTGTVLAAGAVFQLVSTAAALGVRAVREN